MGDYKYCNCHENNNFNYYNDDKINNDIHNDKNNNDNNKDNDNNGSSIHFSDLDLDLNLNFDFNSVEIKRRHFQKN